MRYAMLGLWLAIIVAVGANADEPVSGVEDAELAEPESVVEKEAEADAEIRQIEEGVSGADEVKEFVPKKPLSADKAIALPSDI